MSFIVLSCCESLINITTAEVVLFLFANKCNLVDNYGQVFFVNIFFSISITMYKHYKLTMFVKNPNNNMYFF